MRERYVAGFVDRLPDGAAMSVKTLARQLPLYGQQAVGTALTALSVAGHLRRVRCAVGQGETTRWAFRTFWSRTARDNEWWNAYLADEMRQLDGSESLDGLPRDPAAGGSTAPPPPWVPADEPSDEPAVEPASEPPLDQSPPAPVPAKDTRPVEPAAAQAPCPDQAPRPVAAPPSAPAGFGPVQPSNVPAPEPGNRHSPAYLALAQLARKDIRVALSAADCTALEPLATAWLDRGVSTDYLIHTLTAGLPYSVDSPVALIRRRLMDKIPPQLPTEQDTPRPEAPARRLLVECADCGAPGRPEALPDGLCRPCRTHHASGAAEEQSVETLDAPDVRDVGAYVAELRNRLKAP